jgi:hypothetical protein
VIPWFWKTDFHNLRQSAWACVGLRLTYMI